VTTRSTYFDELAEEFGGGWNRFWFTPASPAPLGKLRIATGLLTIAYFVSWATQLAYWLAGDGVLPPDMMRELLQSQNRHFFHPSPLFAITTPSGLWAYHAVVTAVAVLFTLGVVTRLTSALTLVAVLTYIHRAPLLTSPFETVLVMLLLYLTIAPSGAAYSFDAWRAGRQGRSLATPSWLANIGLRLTQVHLVMFLWLVACSCLASGVWWDGTAIWSLEAQTLSRPLNLSFMRDFPKIVNGWTHLFVLVNLVFPILVWHRLLRPLVIACTALLWLLMIPVTGQVLYVLAVLAAMYAFTGYSALQEDSAIEA
jgi:hypothetical protein